MRYVLKFCYDNEECEYPLLFIFMSDQFVTIAIVLYCTNWMGMALCMCKLVYHTIQNLVIITAFS